MAVIGSAYIHVNAITTNFQGQVENSLKGMRNQFSKAGNDSGSVFSSNLNKQLSKGGGGLSQFKSRALEANEALFRMITTGYAVGPAVAGLISSLSALASGLFAVGAAALSAAPSLIVLPGILAAIGQAALVAKAAFSGVGDAIKELQKGNKGGAAAVDNTKRIEQAERRLAQVLEANRESLARADKNLEKAERSLTEARLEAAESLQQLNFDAEDAALSEKKAAIELEKAREALARVQDLPPNSRARREAELAYAEADLNLRRAKDRNSDLAAETEEANAKGVEGSDRVVDATERLQDAIDNKAKAERDAIRSQIDAEEALAEAKKKADSAGGGSDESAFDKLSEGAQRFVRYIVDEFLPAVDQLKAAAASKIFDPLITALDMLKTDLFPVLEPILADTGEAIGNVAVKIAEVVTESSNLDRIQSIGETNIYVIERMGEAFGYLLDSALTLLDAAGPLIERFSDWVVTLTRGWSETLEAKDQTGELTEMFNQAGDVAAQLGDIFGNIWDALMNIGRAAAGPGSGGQMLLDLFQNATEGWADFTAAALEDGSLEQYFIDVAENFRQIAGFLGELIGAFTSLADNKGIAEFWQSLRDNDVPERIGDILDRLTSSGDTLAEFFDELLETIDIFTETGSIEAFFSVLTGGLEALNNFLRNDTVQSVLLTAATFLGFMKGFTVAKRVVEFFFYAFTGYFGKIFDIVLKVKGALGAVGGLFNGGAVMGAGVVAAVAAIAGAIYLMWQNSETFRQALKDLVEGVMEAAIAAWERLKEGLDKALEPLGGMSGAWESLNYWMGQVGDFLGKYIIPIIQNYLVYAITFATEAIVLFIGIVSSIIQVFQGVWEFVQGIFALFKGDMDGVREHFGAAWDKIKGAVETAISFIYDFFVNIFQAMLDFLLPWDVNVRGIFSAIGDFIAGVWDKIKIAFEIAWEIIKVGFEVGAAVITVAIEAIKIAWDVMSTALKWAFDNVIKPLVFTPFEIGIGAIKIAISGITTAFDGVKTGMKFAYDNVISPLVITPFKAAIDGIKLAIDGIKAAFGLLKSGMKIAYENTIGPLVITPFKTAVDLVKGAIDGIKTAFEAVKTAMETAWTKIKEILDGMKNAADKALGPIDEIIGFAGSGVSKAVGWLNPFAEGGIVTRPTASLIGEAGPEVVIPLAREKAARREELLRQSGLLGGGGGVVINMTVNPSAGMSESDLASVVSRELAFQLRRGAMR